jgi:hypothetical protein
VTDTPFDTANPRPGGIGAVRRHPLLLLAAVAALSTIGVAVLHRAGGPPGLLLTVSIPGDAGATPIHQGIDDILTRQNTERMAMLGGGRPGQLRWDGFLWANDTREYEVRVAADVPARLWLNGHVVFESPGGRDVPPARVRMRRGQQLIEIDYGPATRSTRFGFEWDDENPYRLTSVPRAALSPRSLTAAQWAAHRIAPAITAAVCALWFAVACCIAVAPVWRLARRELIWTRALTITFAGCAVLSALGIWWGGIAGWAPDEMTPGYILQAMQQHFGRGWYDRYPPLHVYVIGLAYLPLALAHSLHWLSVYSPMTDAIMVGEGRAISVLMAMATLVAVALLAKRTFGEKYVWPAVLCTAAFLPFAFYAKLANVEAPYLCWFAWSLVFLTALYEHGRLRDAVALGVTAAAAVGTKDQAYGLYVLPAIALLWRFGRSRAGWALLAAGAVAAVLTLALIYNVVFNYQGFRDHLTMIKGPASTGYRMFPATAEGSATLFFSTSGQLLSGIGVTGIALILAGIGSPVYRRARPALMLLALSAASYYVTFIAVVGYIYDRFLMPVSTILALFAALGVRRLLDAERWRPVGRAAATLLLVWLVARAGAVDLLMIRDSRVFVEGWLRSHVKRHETVGAPNQFVYLPRLDQFRRELIFPSIPGTMAARPEYVVLNREYSDRYKNDPDALAWLIWLESGTGPYQEVLRYKSNFAWTPLALDRRFTDRVQDPFTNLDKANPEIAVFRRRD